MSIINQLPHILEEARGRNQHIPPGVFHLTEVWGPEENPAHRVFRGDNLSLMKSMSEDRETAGRVQMIYIDPPFFTRSDYDAVVEAGEKFQLSFGTLLNAIKEGDEEEIRRILEKAKKERGKLQEVKKA